MDATRANRRRMLAVVGGSVASSVAFASCLDDGQQSEENDEGTAENTEPAGSNVTADDGMEDATDGENEKRATEGNDEGSTDAIEEIDEEFVDRTGEETVEIETREGTGDEPAFVFDPAFVRVDEGSVVEWVNTDGVFHTATSSDSIDDRSGGEEFDETIASEGETFEWEATEAGVQPYYCSPHAGFMYGALEIV
ncbi:plastocyanin/azurin family copper-binding protein [Natrialba sp. INN-245]|uniref:cupredoxin domain-containing protein n=1 Tax=Natrialba sp. INN-245 TaxID=2690967 RepID=UPI00130F766E|nr:plastocyanin/azurin family copper-binding protein [Natrialba sp. INN-245]MWV40250.1 hypothetical protein [Natrialba sp. INN-245]